MTYSKYCTLLSVDETQRGFLSVLQPSVRGNQHSCVKVSTLLLCLWFQGIGNNSSIEGVSSHAC